MIGSQNSTVQNATHYGPSCPQVDRGGYVPGPFDEDCLYLNVWAPNAPPPTSAGYPVMLWIHGGAFLQGGAAQVLYDGLSWTNAAIQDNNSFILVSINYRLNIMGYFSQSALLDDKGQIIANQGITDQRMAMKWIRDNIKQCGGNINSVTLMGESAGSQSICIHLVSPLSTGLFQAAIMESGSCDTLSYLRDTSFALSTANNLAPLVGCNMTDSVQQLTCLQTVNSSLLVATIANVSTPPSMSLAFKDIEKVAAAFPFGLIVDGIEIPVHPLQAFLSGNFNHVPILTGANHDEYLLRVLYEDYSYPPTSAEDYLTRVLPIATYNYSDVQALYALNKFNGNYSAAFVTLLSQGIFICGARRMAGYMTGQPTYLYTYNHAAQFYYLTLPSLVIWPGAYHSAEVFSLFRTLAPTLYGDTIFEPAELPLATSLRQYWTNMITKHHPNDNSSFA
jgi:para-nitrobenzyl esterase